MPASNLSVYVIDDEADVRKSLHFLLSTSGIRTWPFAGGQDFVDQLSGLEPAPILLDVRMPGIDGFGVMAELAARDLDWPVIIMTAHGDVPVAVRAMKLGAIEFIEKPFSADDLEIAVRRGFALLEEDRERRDRQVEARHRLDALSPREREVIGQLVKGAPNKVAAHLMALSTRTIEMHRANALQKLGLRSLAEAASLISTARLETFSVKTARKSF
jgi:two-component system response regulator FixJ